MKVQKLKNQNGITLVALVITTIILLVLAGITVVALSGENGLFSKTKQAREKYSISEAKEKLTTKLMQLQTEVTDEEQRSATIEDINKLVDENSKYYDKEIESVKDRNENKLVKISGYYFEVDSKLNIVGNIDATELTVTDTTYKVNSTNGNIMNVTVNIKNEIGIQKVIKPDNTDVTPAGTKEQVAIDYDVEDGKEYKFKVQLIGSNEQKEYTLKANLNAKPEIKQNESNAYPLLTKYGVEINKTVKIDYGESTNNYYSLDNGNSWIKYTEDGVSIKKEGKILAKSIINGEITKESQENIIMQLADNAIGEKAYDGDETTGAYYLNGGKRYINIDTELIGKKIKVIYTYESWREAYFEDENNNKIGNIIVSGQEIIIPEGAKKLYLWSGRINIIEIMYSNEPDIVAYQYHPSITVNGIIDPYCKIKIDYDEDAIKRLYSINGGDWSEYKDNETIIIKEGEKICAKSINIMNQETKISEYTATIPNDSIGANAYDKDKSTGAYYLNGGKRYMDISPEVIGKKIKVYYTYESWREAYFVDENDNKIGNIIISEQETIIPEGAKKIYLWSGRINIIEIELVN